VNSLWFRARTYGWGWTPVTVEGWLVVTVFLAAIIANTIVFIYRVRTGSDIRSATITFLVWFAILTGAHCHLLDDWQAPALAMGKLGHSSYSGNGPCGISSMLYSCGTAPCCSLAATRTAAPIRACGASQVAMSSNTRH
jgi:hypothetical protein